MIQLTTPNHEFTLPLDVERLKQLRIIYKQGEVLKIVKEMDDCVCEGNVVSVRLSQEETNSFVPGVQVEIQVRALTRENEALASRKFIVECYECIDDGVVMK